MVSTRSKTNQKKLDDFNAPNGTINKGRHRSTPKKPTAETGTNKKTSTSRKRKSPATSLSEVPESKRISKEFPKQELATNKEEENETKVMINRAPVIQLWSACVTHFIFPELSWETCLSAGSAISTICAVAKGRSIGTISERDDSESAQHKRDSAKERQKDLDIIEVMHFKLKVSFRYVHRDAEHSLTSSFTS
jgi:hypothetical protein